MKLNQKQLERYNRHILLEEFGEEGQQKIAESRVLVIGSGGLGSPALYYLAASGIGKIGIMDGDHVELSNLQRQIIHSTNDFQRPKVESAKESIQALNPDVQVEAIRDIANADNILDYISDYDFVIDGTDNFSSKFLINDACVISGKPFVHSGVLRYQGQIMTVVPPESACYRCVFMEPPPRDSVPSCSQVGIMSMVPGILGTMQAAECFKYLAGIDQLLTNRLLVVDLASVTFNEVKIKKNPKCPVCGDNPIITTPRDSAWGTSEKLG
jgi:molybdopterin-synthase adenylyltransferase